MGNLLNYLFKKNPLDELLVKEKVQITGLLIAVLENVHTKEKRIIPGWNVVTNDGDSYYAQSACAETPDDDFDAAGAGLRLGDDNTAPTKADIDVTSFISGTDMAIEATYPLTDDQDGDNTGAGVDIVTWLYTYTTAQGNGTGIIEGAISDVRAGPSTAVLTHFLFAASFDKTASDTLKVFINHEMLGV